MWNLIITKLFCHHKWRTHAKDTNFRTQETVEVLICPDCGKIKIIKY